MINVSVYYNADCPLCPEYLRTLSETCVLLGFNHEQTSLQADPVKIVNVLLQLRGKGNVITVFPFFVVSGHDLEMCYDGLLTNTTLKSILNSYGS